MTELGGCAEMSAADQLVRADSDPAKIKFTEAIRPRVAWHESEQLREHGTTPSLTENISSPFERETSTCPEMRAQFEDKKLPTYEFTMMVDGE